MSEQIKGFPAPLSAACLRQETNAAVFKFKTTNELTDVHNLAGQKRAETAISLAGAIEHKDFNIYVAGPIGTGRHSMVNALLQSQSEKLPLPCDWVYVNNFDSPHKPIAVRVPSGMAKDLKSAMEKLVDDLTVETTAAFESEDYQTKRRMIEQEFGERREAAFADFYEAAKDQGVAVIETPEGFTLTALRNGSVIKEEVYEALGADQRAAIDEKIAHFQEQLGEILQSLPREEREHRDRLEKLHAQLAKSVVSERVGTVRKRFCDVASVCSYLERVQEDMINNAEIFLQARHAGERGPFPDTMVKFHLLREFRRYAVNVMVSNTGADHKGAPLETEILPNLGNLTGRIENESEMGILHTDFTLIKPGALHRANGGYLVIDAERLISEPFAWETLKRCLKHEAITISSAGEIMGLNTTASLEPDPIPLKVRIVLIGSSRLYHLLFMLDEEFETAFKVLADFETDAPRTARNLQLFARMLGSAARKNGLLALAPDGVARAMDEAVRQAEDVERYSLRLSNLVDILTEADHYAKHAKRSIIGRDEINQALEQAQDRSARIRERSYQMIEQNTLLIDTQGAAIGQINGLSVLDLGTHRFGQPTRITARVRMGAGKVVDIEREAELGGSLHSKGVLILSGYLATHYALDVPMSLHASIVFEQSYGGVDGDSASSTELYALLSALSDIPIQQCFAVTGSVNQAGEVQAIGGVNEKIEGFFDICKARRLTGKQGVLIPKSNVRNLMLRPDVVEACRNGMFSVTPIQTIDEGISLLTGKNAGKRNKKGLFPKDSINYLVEEKMRAYAEMRRGFAGAALLGGSRNEQI